MLCQSKIKHKIFEDFQILPFSFFVLVDPSVLFLKTIFEKFSKNKIEG